MDGKKVKMLKVSKQIQKKKINAKGVKKAGAVGESDQAGPKESNILPGQVIQKKRDGKALTEEEIRFFIDGLSKGTLPEY